MGETNESDKTGLGMQASVSEGVWKWVSPKTCPRYWKLAEQMNLTRLALACKRQCLKEFREMGSSSELGSLSKAMMRELLEDAKLQAESEVAFIG